MSRDRTVASFLLIWLYLGLADCERLKNLMYDNLEGAACFRRLNGTHTTGCSSTFRGSVGVLHLLKSVEDLDFLLSSPPAAPYVAVLPPTLFTRQVVMQLKQKGLEGVVSGILLINQRTGLSFFSQESQCPNEFSSLQSTESCSARNETTWNPFGTNLMNEDFPFPIFYVNEEKEVTKLINCFDKYNSFDLPNQATRALCSVQIKTLMSAAGNSKVCLSRGQNSMTIANTRYCDGLQGKNVFGTLFERPEAEDRKTDPSEKFILVTSRIDTVTMFDNHYLGAMDSLVPFTVLIAVAQFLKKVLPDAIPESPKRNVLFAFFNGESLDFIGSQRFVYDMTNNLFPDPSTLRNVVTPENIELMVDLGTFDDLQNIKAYAVEDFDLASKLVDTLNTASTSLKAGITAERVKESKNFPPFSAQSFWRENGSFPAVTLTSSPSNRFFHSIYDDEANVQFRYLNTSKDFTELEPISAASDNIQLKIRNLATVLGATLYELLTGKNYTEQLGVNVALVDEFMFCFLVSSNCTFFNAIVDQGGLHLSDKPPGRYIGVNTGAQAYIWTYQAVGFVLGKKVNRNREECQRLPYQWYNGVNLLGECRLTTHNFSAALSPAFLEENYDWSSNKYSTWTESTWSEISARIFLQPSRAHNALTLAVGIVVFLISLVLVYLIKSRADILFADSVSTTPITPPAVNC